MPYWRLFYHFVWRTKNGDPLIVPEWEGSLHNVIVAKATDLGAFVYAAADDEFAMRFSGSNDTVTIIDAQFSAHRVE